MFHSLTRKGRPGEEDWLSPSGRENPAYKTIFAELGWSAQAVEPCLVPTCAHQARQWGLAERHD